LSSESTPTGKRRDLTKAALAIAVIAVAAATGLVYFQLSGQLGSLQADHSALQGQYASLNTTYVALNGSYNSLTADHSALQADHSALQGQYASLNTTYVALSGDYDELAANYNGLQADYSGLQGEYNALADDYEGLEDSYDALLLERNGLYDIANYLVNYTICSNEQDTIPGGYYLHWTQQVPHNGYITITWSSNDYIWFRIYGANGDYFVESSDEVYQKTGTITLPVTAGMTEFQIYHYSTSSSATVTYSMVLWY